MGADFQQKTEKTIRVARDRDAEALAAGDLFTRRVENLIPFELLRLQPGRSLQPDDHMDLQYSADRIVGVIAGEIVGEIQKPSKALISMLRDYGIVGGRVEVASARVADIELIE